MERLLLNITKRDTIRHEIIRSETGVKDVIERVRCMKGQWARLIARMSNTRWVKITSEWTSREGKRVRGRPKRRWRDNIEEFDSSQWMRVVQSRSAWRKWWRPSASSGMNGWDDDDDDDGDKQWMGSHELPLAAVLSCKVKMNMKRKLESPLKRIAGTPSDCFLTPLRMFCTGGGNLLYHILHLLINYFFLYSNRCIPISNHGAVLSSWLFQGR